MTATVRDQIIADATSLPDLIQKASVLDPALAALLTSNATASSKTPVGALVAAALTYLTTVYGLHWPPEFVGLLSGSAVLLGGYLTHWAQAKLAKPALPAPPVAPAK